MYERRNESSRANNWDCNESVRYVRQKEMRLKVINLHYFDKFFYRNNNIFIFHIILKLIYIFDDSKYERIIVNSKQRRFYSEQLNILFIIASLRTASKLIFPNLGHLHSFDVLYLLGMLLF